jgi:hypothetical protein
LALIYLVIRYTTTAEDTVADYGIVDEIHAHGTPAYVEHPNVNIYFDLSVRNPGTGGMVTLKLSMVKKAGVGDLHASYYMYQQLAQEAVARSADEETGKKRQKRDSYRVNWEYAGDAEDNTKASVNVYNMEDLAI